jgi:foldase protein PrsA
VISLNLVRRSALLVLALAGVSCAPPPDLSSEDAAQLAQVVNAAMQSPLEQDNMGTPGAAAVALPLNEAGQPVVARVNETEILQTDLDRAIQRYVAQQIPGMTDETHRMGALNALIDQILINEAAAAQNVEVTDAEVQAELDANMQIAGSPEAWNTWLAQNLYTADEFRQTLRDTLLTTRMRDLVTQDLSSAVPHVHARHILVATELQANEVIARLNSGEDFGALAAAYSTDVTTREQGGDLGWFAQGELLEPYLSDIAFSLEPGQVAGPIATSLGYHVVQTIERADQVVPEEKRAQVAQGQFELWLSGLRSAANIEIY